MLEHKRRWNSWTLSVWNCFWKKKAEQFFLLLLLFSLCVCVCVSCVCVCVWVCCVSIVCVCVCVCVLCVLCVGLATLTFSFLLSQLFQDTPPQLGNHSPLTYSFYLFSTTKQNQMISEDFQALNLFLFTDHSTSGVRPPNSFRKLFRTLKFSAQRLGLSMSSHDIIIFGFGLLYQKF